MYDWNTAKVPNWRGAHHVAVVDETLRDGLQNATAIDPPIEAKLEMLTLMEKIGVDVVSVGLPAASKRALDQAATMTAFIRDNGLELQPTGAARTVAADVQGVAEVAQRTGTQVEVYAFIGSSPIRHYTENWDIGFLTKHISEAVQTARREGIPFCLVTEDTTRARPEMLSQLFKCALDGGAARLCLCDTVGHATPDGVARLVRWTKDLLIATGNDGQVGLDWHAHNDRGLALQTALWASEVGVDRIHGTALGIGERVGNVPLELMALNLGLLRSKPLPARSDLRAYCERAASAMQIGGIPDTHPLFGKAARGSNGTTDDEAGGSAAGGSPAAGNGAAGNGAAGNGAASGAAHAGTASAHTTPTAFLRGRRGLTRVMATRALPSNKVHAL